MYILLLVKRQAKSYLELSNVYGGGRVVSVPEDLDDNME